MYTCKKNYIRYGADKWQIVEEANEQLRKTEKLQEPDIRVKHRRQLRNDDTEWYVFQLLLVL